jgi:peptide/nickel transport system permease protein
VLVLFLALGTLLTLLLSASLAFLGFMNPFIPSWAMMVRNAFDAGQMARAWWWSFPPGFLISLTVMSSFMLGQGYEARSYEEQIG